MITNTDTSTKSVREICRNLRAPNSTKEQLKVADVLDALLDERENLEALAFHLHKKSLKF